MAVRSEAAGKTGLNIDILMEPGVNVSGRRLEATGEPPVAKEDAVEPLVGEEGAVEPPVS